MAGGAVLSAVAFIAAIISHASYPATIPKLHRKRTFGTTKLLRPTRRPMPNIKKTAQSFSIVLQQMIGSKIRRTKTSLTPTTLSSSTTKLTNTSKSQGPKSLSSLTSINKGSSKNKANSYLLALAPLHLGTPSFASFKKIFFLFLYIP